jgi:hypothetical protein
MRISTPVAICALALHYSGHQGPRVRVAQPPGERGAMSPLSVWDSRTAKPFDEAWGHDEISRLGGGRSMANCSHLVRLRPGRIRRTRHFLRARNELSDAATTASVVTYSRTAPYLQYQFFAKVV